MTPPEPPRSPSAGSSPAPRTVPAPADLRRVLVLSSKWKPDAHASASALADAVARRGIEARLDLEAEAGVAEAARRASLVLVVGGDGTLLNAARRLEGAQTPAVGVNIGRLGFLAEFTVDEVLRYLDGGAAPFRVVPRLVLRCTIRRRGDGPGEGPLLALNDAVIAQGPVTRLMAIEMLVDGGEATNWFADGVVVSTPTGSTAYSLSLGGPILTPGADAIIVTPIAPHSLTANRTLLVEGSSTLLFRVTRDVPSLALVLDGHEARPLPAGSEVEVARAPAPFLLASHAGRSYWELLRAKFHWGEPPSYGPPPTLPTTPPPRA
jgi:NAD+ kinase